MMLSSLPDHLCRPADRHGGIPEIRAMPDLSHLRQLELHRHSAIQECAGSWWRADRCTSFTSLGLHTHYTRFFDRWITFQVHGASKTHETVCVGGVKTEVG